MLRTAKNTVGMSFSGKRSCRRAFFGCFQGFRSCEPEGRGAGWLSYCYRTQYGLHSAQKAGQGTGTVRFPGDGCSACGGMSAGGMGHSRERWNTLAAVWPQLAPTERFCWRRYFQQRSDRELSDDLGCGANSIRMMMTRARPSRAASDETGRRRADSRAAKIKYGVRPG